MRSKITNSSILYHEPNLKFISLFVKRTIKHIRMLYDPNPIYYQLNQSIDYYF